jgi:putative transposase
METLQHYRWLGHFKLHAFVVMPDHVHLLLTPGELALERVVGLIKGGFSHKVGSKSPVWQRGFSDRRMRDRAEFEIRRDYIHQNPVRAKLVKQMRDYPFSSAHRADVNAAYLRG